MPHPIASCPGWPLVGWPLVGSPLIGSPLVGSPLVGSPLVGSPLVGSPLVGSPLVGSPLVGAPLVIPAPTSPHAATSRETLRANPYRPLHLAPEPENQGRTLTRQSNG
jgi:hypothetical protein